jgi:hypothetical protein
MSDNPYIDDLDRMRSLLLIAESSPSLPDALLMVAEAEACERRLSHRADAPICAMIREALIARANGRHLALAALPDLRAAAALASERAIMHDRPGGNYRHLCGIDEGLSRAVGIVEQAAARLPALEVTP